MIDDERELIVKECFLEGIVAVCTKEDSVAETSIKNLYWITKGYIKQAVKTGNDQDDYLRMLSNGLYNSLTNFYKERLLE